MISFPDLDTLSLALSRGAVPPAVAQSPVRAGFDPTGRVCVQPSVPLPPETRASLEQIGAEVRENRPSDLDQELYCWHALLPLVPGNGKHGADVPVLFKLT